MTTIARIAESQRALNTARITLTTAALTAVAVPATWLLEAPSSIVVLMAVVALGMAHAYWLTRGGKPGLAALLLGAWVFVQHAASVAIGGVLGPVPYIAPIIILVAAATLEAHWLWPAFGVTLSLIALEALLSRWSPADQTAVVTAGLFSGVVFAVSLLHSRGMQRAFDLARKEDQARVEIEKRLMAAARLEALGRMAGSVAHDFNNLLTVISGSASLAESTLPAGHTSRRELAAVRSATESATLLTRQLLTFSKKQIVFRSRVDVGAALHSHFEVLKRMIGKSVLLEFAFEPNLPPVVMSVTHLEQLVSNLAVNARDAMPRGGRLRLTVGQRILKDREIGALPAARYVELTVADDGVGIAEDVLPHVFEPFFSTKGEAGTGLGLATCHSVVTELGGSIVVESTPGTGTTFRVLLPACEGDESVAVEPKGAPAVKRVLVVDDEVAVRETTARMLRSGGYDVLTASTLTEAHEILSDERVALDALLTDVVLNGERGTDLLERCRDLRPDARMLVMSGYTSDPGAADTLVSLGAHFLPKPFDREQLLKAIQAK